MDIVSRAWDETKNLLFPVQCAGCQVWDTELCSACAALATGEPTMRALDDIEGRPALEITALGRYEGRLRSIILAAKHDPHRDLSRFLMEAGRKLGEATGRQLALQLGRGAKGSSSLPPFPLRIWVVPAPSSHMRRLQRAEIVPLFAKGVVEGLRAELHAAVYPVGKARGRGEGDLRVGRGSDPDMRPAPVVLPPEEVGVGGEAELRWRSGDDPNVHPAEKRETGGDINLRGRVELPSVDTVAHLVTPVYSARPTHPVSLVPPPRPAPSVQLASVVALRWGVRGQSGRSAASRITGRQGVMRLLRPLPPHTAVIVVDDVVASGATVEAVVDLFEGRVLFGVALAA